MQDSGPGLCQLDIELLHHLGREHDYILVVTVMVVFPAMFVSVGFFMGVTMTGVIIVVVCIRL
ncbi:MAG: hypothetical protein Q7Q73_07665 [Verrucomicrobiota bacterium JB024]|nr:hypothetical protein [Verrucomicrobiota bacterium JB024]